MKIQSISPHRVSETRAGKVVVLGELQFSKSEQVKEAYIEKVYLRNDPKKVRGTNHSKGRVCLC